MTYPCGHPRTKENTYRNYAGAYCKTCDNERTRRYRQLNPDYNARYLREWRGRHPGYNSIASRQYRERRRKRPLLLVPLPVRPPKPKGARVVSFDVGED